MHEAVGVRVVGHPARELQWQVARVDGVPVGAPIDGHELHREAGVQALEVRLEDPRRRFHQADALHHRQGHGHTLLPEPSTPGGAAEQLRPREVQDLLGDRGVVAQEAGRQRHGVQLAGAAQRGLDERLGVERVPEAEPRLALAEQVGWDPRAVERARKWVETDEED